MKPNKAPCFAGLTMEFYKTFQVQFCPILEKLLIYCLHNNQVPETWKSATITLIPTNSNQILLSQTPTIL